MNPRLRSLLIVLTIVALTTGGAVWAAEQKKAEEAATQGPGAGHDPAASSPDKPQPGGMSRMMKMHGLSPEKVEAVRKIVESYQEKFFALRQDTYAKEAEIEAVMAQAQPDMAKAKALAKERGALEEAKINLQNERRAQIIKETGLRFPMGGGHMGPRMSGGAMGPGRHGQMTGPGGRMGPGQRMMGPGSQMGPGRSFSMNDEMSPMAMQMMDEEFEEE